MKSKKPIRDKNEYSFKEYLKEQDHLEYATMINDLFNSPFIKALKDNFNRKEWEEDHKKHVDFYLKHQPKDEKEIRGLKEKIRGLKEKYDYSSKDY